MKGSRQVTDFECSVNAVRAVGSFLRGEDHGGMSTGPSSQLLGRIAALPPAGVRAKTFELAGLAQGIPPKKVPEISLDAIDEWVVSEYTPDEGGAGFPAVVIGCAGGPAFFLAAALGVPFLPQTTLVAVRDGATHPDDPRQALQNWESVTAEIARRNPRAAVFHMHDPVQDRPMMKQVAFFRLKRRELGPAYEGFLRDHLAPGGTIIQVENTRDWRVTEVGIDEVPGRAFFQFGCLGGIPEEEFHAPGERIAAFLEQEGSAYRRWDPPQPTGRRPDGEWGWDPALGEDIARFAERAALQRRRLVQNEPQDASAFIAELYRSWYRRIGWQADRLLAQTYGHVDPYWTVRTGSVPFWNRFHEEPTYQVLRDYLQAAAEYREVRISLFAHGVESPGLVSYADWDGLAREFAAATGEVIGVDPEAYPLDTGANFRYQKAIESLPQRREFPEPLTVDDVDRFAASGEAPPGTHWMRPSD